jgi:hypothetical protein
MKEFRSTSDFHKGMRVRYTPTNIFGAVSSTNEKFVFVKYDNTECNMVTGDEPYTAQATKAEDLEVVRCWN